MHTKIVQRDELEALFKEFERFATETSVEGEIGVITSKIFKEVFAKVLPNFQDVSSTTLERFFEVQSSLL